MNKQQVKAYLERVGLGHLKPGKPDLELLNTLVEHHQLAVPFEDLDPYELRKPVSLELDELFSKIVVERRGGYCFELNKLFEALLKACGFEVWSSIGRNVRGSAGGLQDELPPVMHRSELVRLDGGLYGVDVGYGGPMPACAFLVEQGSRVESCGKLFELRRLDGAWWQIAYRRADAVEGAPFAPVVNFMESPAQEADFELMSYWCCNHSSSPFLNNLICSRRLKGGNVYLRNTVLTRTLDGQKTITELQKAQVPQVLEEEFGIRL